MKHLPNFRLGTLALVASCVLMGCEPDPAGELDTLLDEALEEASNGAGRVFFRLPSDGDFRNLPADPRNEITRAKVELGQMLFHETALGTNSRLEEGRGTFSCASCHHVQAAFSAGTSQGIGDGGVAFGISGEGRRAGRIYPEDSLDVQPIRSPSALNVAYQEVSLWNGAFGGVGLNANTEASWTAGTLLETNYLGYEGPETQAIAGLQNHRMLVDEGLLKRVPEYRRLFDQAFGDRPRNQRVNVETAGLAIAAYERTLLSNRAPFQRWLAGDMDAMNDQEKNGALLFFGKARCATCHTGPALNSDSFHALGMKGLHGPGVLQSNPNHDAHLGRGGFTGAAEDMYRFKTPQLYNLREMGPLGHGSTMANVREVVDYYNAGVAEDPTVPRDQLSPLFVPLNLSEDEVVDLTMFLENGLFDPNLMRHVPTETPSGQCFPNNDAESRADLGCG